MSKKTYKYIATEAGALAGGKMDARRLSRELRLGKGRYLRNRRGIVGATLTAMGCMGLISLFQMGMIKRLPEPPGKWFDAEKVDASEEAYGHLQMGDAFIGMGSYSVTAALAAMGGAERARTAPWLPLLLAAKAGADAAQAGRLTYHQFSRQRAACIWCLVAAAASMATALLALPEAREGYRRLRYPPLSRQS